MKHCYYQCRSLASERLSLWTRNGFTLIELLLVIAIIGIMSALIITTVSNAAQDSRLVVARQQQVTLQDALNAWIAANSCGTNSLLSARTAYSTAVGSGAGTNTLALLSNYLHPETYSHLTDTNYSTANRIRSEAMSKAGVYLQFSTWSNTTTYPVVNWYNN